MVQANPQIQTFEDFLNHTEAVDGFFELTNGVLVEMLPEADANLYRALKLYEALKACGRFGSRRSWFGSLAHWLPAVEPRDLG
jgi:Uma2 family endonuclease